MKRCLIVGKTNVGKTVFAVNFAAFLGRRELAIAFQTADGRVTGRYSRCHALTELTGPQPHTTRCLAQIPVALDVGKGEQLFEIVDTAGLADAIPGEATLRAAMAQTLGALRGAGLILHLLDASQAQSPDLSLGIGEVDRQLARFAGLAGPYVILANKMDLPGAAEGLAYIRSELPGLRVLPVSALYQQGFREVRNVVRRAL